MRCSTEKFEKLIDADVIGVVAVNTLSLDIERSLLRRALQSFYPRRILDCRLE